MRAFVYCVLACGCTVLAWAADGPTSITGLAGCINEKLVGADAVDITTAIERCVPQGCKVTASMSTQSAQPACVVAGTQLPRVYLSCPGPGAGLRFRPTFTLCPNDANRIEVGEDVAPAPPSTTIPMQMANFPMPFGQPLLHEITDFLNTPNNNLRCTRCHGSASPGVTGDTPLLSNPFDPFTTTRRNLLPFVVFTTEPTRKALVSPSATVAGLAVQAQTLEQTCAKMASVLEGNPFAYGASAPSQGVCNALASYVQKRSCGQGAANARCVGLVGGGIFVNDGVSSTVALELSGQAVFESDTPERLVFKANDIDGTLTATAGASQTTVNGLALSTLERVDGADGSYAFTGSGKALVNGVSTAVSVRISFDGAGSTSGVTIARAEDSAVLAGGTAAGVRFTVTTSAPPPKDPAGQGPGYRP